MTPADSDTPRATSAIEELGADPSSRKRFLRSVGGTGAAGAFALLLAACGSKKVKNTPGGSNPNTGAGAGTDQYGKGDLGIVRYALTLEYVESDFYEQALKTGRLKGRAADLAKRFGAQERTHVLALEEAVGKLGGTPPLKPKPNFPLQSANAILGFALNIESLGAAALLAQADRIQDKQLLATALTMHSVEGRHVAAIATLLGKSPTPDGAFSKPAQAPDVLNQLHSLNAPG
jgi:rubrerythrin